MKTKKAIIKKGTGKKSNQFYFTLHSKNGKVVGEASEHYTRKSNLKQTLRNNFSDFVIVDTTLSHKSK